MKVKWISLGNLAFILAFVLTPGTFAWKAPILAFGAGMLAWAVRDFLMEDKGLARRRKEELQRQHIRELEKELGFSPLELGDPTAPVAEPVNRDTRKGE